MSKYVLALDQGTTSSRSILFDRKGQIVAVAQREFAQHFPQPGWVEHDATEIWATQRDTMTEVLSRVGVHASDIAAIGITNQRETTMLWDRATGAPIAKAIVWQDRRTAPLCQRLREAGAEAQVTAITGLLLDPYFSGTKLAWLLDKVPGARARAERGELCFGTIDSWLAWNLTGGQHHITDVSNASRTLLMNLRTGDWDESMLDLLDIPPACLPTIARSALSRGVTARIGTVDVPLMAMVGDQQAAMFGQNCTEPGMAKNTYGTGCFLLLHTGTEPYVSKHRLLTTVAASRDKLEYALEGSVFIGGAAVQWLRDGLGIIEHSSDVEALAASVSDNGGVYMVPAFTGLGSPYWDAEARGTILGITRGTTRAHIARATLEGIAFQSAEVLLCMEKDARLQLRELRVDGGASQNNLLLQIQADLLGVPVVRPKVTETTALGAAYLAGLAAGFWKSAAEVASLWQLDRVFEPQKSRDFAAAQLAIWRLAVERARNWSR